MNISPVQSPGVNTFTQSANSEKDTFLELLVTQLIYQDPLSPMDNEEFAAQLAQFSQLEQLQQINAHLSNTAAAEQDSAQSIDNVLAATLIGNQVEATDSSIINHNGKPVDLNFRLSDTAENLTVTIADVNGQTIREINASSLSAGDHRITWNGKDQNDQPVPDGPYSYTITATRGDTPVTVSPYVSGLVQNVSFESGQIRLNIGGHLVALSDITKIMDAVE